MCVCECVIVLRGIRGWWVVRVCVCVCVGVWGYLEYIPCFSNKPPAWCHCSPAWEEIRTGRAVVWAPIETQCASKPPRSPQQNLKMHTHTHTLNYHHARAPTHAPAHTGCKGSPQWGNVVITDARAQTARWEYEVEGESGRERKGRK